MGNYDGLADLREHIQNIYSNLKLIIHDHDSMSTQQELQQLTSQVQLLTQAVLVTRGKIKPCHPNKS